MLFKLSQQRPSLLFSFLVSKFFNLIYSIPQWFIFLCFSAKFTKYFFFEVMNPKIAKTFCYSFFHFVSTVIRIGALSGASGSNFRGCSFNFRSMHFLFSLLRYSIGTVHQQRKLHERLRLYLKYLISISQKKNC